MRRDHVMDTLHSFCSNSFGLEKTISILCLLSVDSLNTGLRPPHLFFLENHVLYLQGVWTKECALQGLIYSFNVWVR